MIIDVLSLRNKIVLRKLFSYSSVSNCYTQALPNDWPRVHKFSTHPLPNSGTISGPRAPRAKRTSFKKPRWKKMFAGFSEGLLPENLTVCVPKCRQRIRGIPVVHCVVLSFNTGLVCSTWLSQQHQLNSAPKPCLLYSSCIAHIRTHKNVSIYIRVLCQTKLPNSRCPKKQVSDTVLEEIPWPPIFLSAVTVIIDPASNSVSLPGVSHYSRSKFTAKYDNKKGHRVCRFRDTSPSRKFGANTFWNVPETDAATG